jgi:hypothetical protein
LIGFEIQADFHCEIGIRPQRPVEGDVHRGRLHVARPIGSSIV